MRLPKPGSKQPGQAPLSVWSASRPGQPAPSPPWAQSSDLKMAQGGGQGPQRPGTLGRRQGHWPVVLSGKRINKCRQAVTAGFIRPSGELVLSICWSVLSANATEAGARDIKRVLWNLFKPSTCMTQARSFDLSRPIKKE